MWVFVLSGCGVGLRVSGFGMLWRMGEGELVEELLGSLGARWDCGGLRSSGVGCWFVGVCGSTISFLV